MPTDTTKSEPLTFGAFLELVKAVPTTWRLDSTGAIRCTLRNRTCDPLTAVDGGQEIMYRYRHAAARIGMNYSLAVKLAYVTDNIGIRSNVSREQRRLLLEACGLS